MLRRYVFLFKPCLINIKIIAYLLLCPSNNCCIPSIAYKSNVILKWDIIAFNNTIFILSSKTTLLFWHCSSPPLPPIPPELLHYLNNLLKPLKSNF